MNIAIQTFNPHRTPVDKLVRITVARDDLLQRIIDSLRAVPRDMTPTHWIITGQRGLGKTHLLVHLFHEVRTDDKLKDRWLILHQREEEYWRAHSAATFARNLVEHLFRVANKVLPEEEATSELENALKELWGKVSDQNMFTSARAALERFCRKSTRRLLLGAENLDSLFGQFKNPIVEGRLLRDLLQHSPSISMVGTSITSELGLPLGDRKHPLYRLFREEPLSRLTLEEQLHQLRRLAEEDNDKDSKRGVLQFLSKRQSSLKVVHHLSGGNPRLGVILYGVMAGPEVFLETIDLLHGLLDLNTPYFQDRMKDLAAQERPVAAAFCEAEETLTGAEVARIVGMNRNTVYSLLARLRRAGFIELVDPTPGSSRRGKHYQVAEDLFRMWWQYRFDQERLVRKVVEFLAIIYERTELEQFHRTFSDWCSGTSECQFKRNQVELARSYTSSALEFQESGRYRTLIGDHVREIKAFEKAVKLAPEHATDWAKLGIARGKRGDHKGAVDALEKAVQLDPKLASAWSNLSLAKIREGDSAGAVEASEKAVELAPESAKAWAQLGAVRGEQGDHKGAVDALEKAVQLDPKLASAWSNLGLARGLEGDLAGAVEALEKAVELAPESATAWAKLGVARGEQDDHKGAVDALEKAVQLDPKLVEAWHNLGTVELMIDEFAEAVEALEKTVELAPESATAWAKLGAARGEQGDHKSAEDAFEKAVQLDPKLAAAWINLGEARLMTGEFSEAVEALEKAVELAPEDATAWAKLGVARGEQGDNKSAADALEKAVQLEPDSVEAWHNLATARGMLKDIVGEAEASEKVVELDPKSAEGWHHFGTARLRQGEHHAAAEFFNKAIELDPASTDSWEELVRLQLRLGDTSGANETLNKLLKLRSHGPHIYTVLFGLSGLGVISLQKLVTLLREEAPTLDGSHDNWQGLRHRTLFAILTGLDVEDMAMLQERSTMLSQLANSCEKLDALDYASPVFRYYLAMLDSSVVPRGDKMTPKKRANYIMSKVPRERREAIKKLIKFVEENRRDSKGHG
jgi:tetratricopeptide (TPR) repeat protein